jgi:hypothetical protein
LLIYTRSVNNRHWLASSLRSVRIGSVTTQLFGCPVPPRNGMGERCPYSQPANLLAPASRTRLECDPLSPELRLASPVRGAVSFPFRFLSVQEVRPCRSVRLAEGSR